MRILYNSKDTTFKLPFGTLTEGQKCNISIHIPKSCRTRAVKLLLLNEDKSEHAVFSMQKSGETQDHEIFSCAFALATPALYFYYFRITTPNESFALYKQGYDQTNMEAGELWQLSCTPADFTVPREYAGALMYQIFPDRFHQEGTCDVSEKLTPFYIHSDKTDVPDFLPDARGEVCNCDFFGGNLRGIAAKLDYLCELGVQVIYLNPIFKAWSNHRYDTADYRKIDELLGTEADFSALCEQAHARGMRIILDGVFSHTGSNSRYFDKNGVFGNGAYHSPDSPYRSWYDFEEYPHRYTSWWGIETLPCVKELDEGFCDFIIRDEDSVIAHWLRAGADGFRLDVADELPDEFISLLRARLKAIKPDALLIGEVWEDASNKISYGRRRRYFTGGELDSVMNYPFRKGILDYVCGRDSGKALAHTVMELAENYPQKVLHTLMNVLSTHDTPRLLSLLSPDPVPQSKEALVAFTMSSSAMEIALLRARVAVFLQFLLPGMPCIYYGDEIGMQGFGDPFCRGYFRWDTVKNNPLRDFYMKMSAYRRQFDALRQGDVLVHSIADGLLMLERKTSNGSCRAFVNTGAPTELSLTGTPVFFERAHIRDGAAQLDTYGFILETIETT